MNVILITPIHVTSVLHMINRSAQHAPHHTTFNRRLNLSDLSKVQNITLNTDPLVKQYFALLLLLIPLATICGNLLVILSVLQTRTLHTTINFLIMGLALADLMIALAVMPFAVYVEVQQSVWDLGEITCDVYLATDVACSTASILTLTVISFDRYLAVKRPIHYSKHTRNMGRAGLILLFLWVISLVTGLPVLSGVNKSPDRKATECRFYNADFLIYSSIVSFGIPASIVLSLYCQILFAIRKRESVAKKRRTRTVSTFQTSTSKWSSPTNTNASSKKSTIGSWSMLKRRLQSYRKSSISETNDSGIRRHVHNSSAKAYRSRRNKLQLQLSEPAESVPLVSMRRRRSKSNYFEETTAFQTVDYVKSIRKSHKRVNAPSFSPTCVNALTFIDDDSKENLAEMNNCDITVASPSVNHVQLEVESESLGRLFLNEEPERTQCVSDYNLLKIPHYSKAQSANSIVSTASGASSTSTNTNHSASCGGGLAVKRKSNSVARLSKAVNSLINSSQTLVANGSARISIRLQKKRKSSAHPSKSLYSRSTQKKIAKVQRKERKATKTLAVVVSVFLFCWVPFFFLNFKNAICIKLQWKECQVGFLPFFLTTWLGYMNSFMNPIIYTIFNKDFRKAFRKVLLSWRDPDPYSFIGSRV